jgi:hypothetical protein
MIILNMNRVIQILLSRVDLRVTYTFEPLEWIDTVNGLTPVGWTSHVTIKPLSNKFWIAESTKSVWYFVYNVENSDNSDHIEKFTQDYFEYEQGHANIIIDTVNGLTTVGWTSHVTIKPLSNKFWIAESTKWHLLSPYWIFGVFLVKRWSTYILQISCITFRISFCMLFAYKDYQTTCKKVAFWVFSCLHTWPVVSINVC